MKKLFYAVLIGAAVAAGGSAWAQGSAHDSLPKPGTREYYESNPSDAALQLEYERQLIERRDQRERERRAERQRWERQWAEREQWEREQRERDLRARELRDRRDQTARGQWRDRDGDGVRNRNDRFPDDPYRH